MTTATSRGFTTLATEKQVTTGLTTPIRKAVPLMKTGKSPGNDGFPAEYYKEYIDIMALVLAKVYQEAFEKGQVLPPTFNEALISLIPKKDRDVTDPANFRPVSLVNVDCKIVTKVLKKCKFKWVSKGIKYLGVKLSQDLGELPWLNFNPLLQKIETNLEKWVKIKLMLWGKMNLIKMIIAPQFNYLLMMLPITITPIIFKKYDDVVKEFLWEGKKPFKLSN